LVLEPGRSAAGQIVVARIGIADQAPGIEPGASLWTRAHAGATLPARPATGHKGTFGHVLVVAGSVGKTGAAALAAAGAHRTGAGLVTVACPESAHPVLAVQCTEAMTAPLAEGADKALSRAAVKAALELAEARTVAAVGPGLGRGAETLAAIREIALGMRCPLVLDADGVIAFKDDPERLREREGATVLTPHPGEAATLLGLSAAELNRDRVSAARALADRTGAVAVLKGAATVTAMPASGSGPPGHVIVNPTGGPALAAGGSGDVLAGMISGFLAQGVSALEAAALGVFVHGASADRLAASQGHAGILASEVAAGLPPLLAELRAARPMTPFGAADAVDFPEPR